MKEQAIQEIQLLVAEDKLDQALQKLQELLKDSSRLNEVILQTGRLANVQSQIRMGTISGSQADLTKNQIRAGILSLINDLEGKSSEGAAEESSSQPTIIQKADKIYNIDKIDKADFS